MATRMPRFHREESLALARSCAAVAAVLLATAGAGAVEPYETPGVVHAADYLDAELLEGPSWTVAADAINDGLDNTYTVESRFGNWPARGEHQVADRIGEIEALSKLEEVSKTRVFLDAVEASVTAPIRLVRAVSEKPKETFEGLPKGVARWFRRTSFKARETYRDVSEEVKEERAERRDRKEAASEPQSEEDAAAAAAADEERRRELEERVETEARKEALDYLRVTSAERRWYRELGVDPHTDNELLRDAVKSVARVEGLTRFGMKFVGLPSIPGAGAMRRSLDLVWSTDPIELRMANRKRILAAGWSVETAREFEDSELTLTEQTALLDALDDLADVTGREHLFALVLDLETREEARPLATVAALLATLHLGESPLTEILQGSALPTARTRAGGLVVVAAAGAVFYTEEVAEGFGIFTDIHAEEPATERRVYITGITSERFDAEARSRGWEVVDRWRPEAEPAPRAGTEAGPYPALAGPARRPAPTRPRGSAPASP